MGAGQAGSGIGNARQGVPAEPQTEVLEAATKRPCEAAAGAAAAEVPEDAALAQCPALRGHSTSLCNCACMFDIALSHVVALF
jgi:hypothetical protein